ncbi:MAG: hypothetical protein ACRC8Y_05305, partial [Chroococcales cyanobacterium]
MSKLLWNSLLVSPAVLASVLVGSALGLGVAGSKAIASEIPADWMPTAQANQFAQPTEFSANGVDLSGAIAQVQEDAPSATETANILQQLTEYGTEADSSLLTQVTSVS